MRRGAAGSRPRLRARLDRQRWTRNKGGNIGQKEQGKGQKGMGKTALGRAFVCLLMVPSVPSTRPEQAPGARALSTCLRHVLLSPAPDEPFLAIGRPPCTGDSGRFWSLGAIGALGPSAAGGDSAIGSGLGAHRAGGFLCSRSHCILRIASYGTGPILGGPQNSHRTGQRRKIAVSRCLLRFAPDGNFERRHAAFGDQEITPPR